MVRSIYKDNCHIYPNLSYYPRTPIWLCSSSTLVPKPFLLPTYTYMVVLIKYTCTQTFPTTHVHLYGCAHQVHLYPNLSYYPRTPIWLCSSSIHVPKPFLLPTYTYMVVLIKYTCTHTTLSVRLQLLQTFVEQNNTKVKIICYFSIYICRMEVT